MKRGYVVGPVMVIAIIIITTFLSSQANAFDMSQFHWGNGLTQVNSQTTFTMDGVEYSNQGTGSEIFDIQDHYNSPLNVGSNHNDHVGHMNNWHSITKPLLHSKIRNQIQSAHNNGWVGDHHVKIYRNKNLGSTESGISYTHIAPGAFADPGHYENNKYFRVRINWTWLEISNNTADNTNSRIIISDELKIKGHENDLLEQAHILAGSAAIVAHKFDNMNAAQIETIMVNSTYGNNYFDLSQALSPVGNLN